MTFSSTAKRAPLWIDAFDFGRRVLLGGRPVPWDDLAELSAFQRKLDELLGAEVTVLPLADCFAVWLRERPRLAEQMHGAQRPAGALKTMLSADGPRAAIAAAIAAAHGGRPVGLAVPAPCAWALWADEQVGRLPAGDQETVASRAAAYLAGFLRAFGDTGVEYVLIDGDGNRPSSEFEPIVKVARHYRWQVVVRDDARSVLDVSAVLAGAELEPECQGDVIEVELVYARVPEDASVEQVLVRLASLRGERTTWAI